MSLFENVIVCLQKCHTNPVEVAGVSVLPLRGKMFADSRGLADHHESKRHKKRGHVVRL